jgi:hypothetical protein
VGAVLALKNTTFIAVASTWAAYLLFVGQGRVRDRSARLVGIGVVALVVVSPWMWAHYQATGSALYPVLGTGHECPSTSILPRASALGSGPGTGLSSALLGVLGDSIWWICLAWTVGFWLTSRERLGGRLASQLFLLAVAAVVTVGLAGEQSEVGFFRYVTPCFQALATIVLVELARTGEWESHRGARRRTGLIVMLLSLVPFVLRADQKLKSFKVANVWQTMRENDSARRSVPVQQALGALQSHVEPGRTILARLDTPYLLDFERNPVHVVDYACMVSPGGCMPCEGDAEELARFLRARGIRYIAYSYGSEAGHSRRAFEDRLEHPNPRWRMLTRLNFAFQDRLVELSRRYEKVADDGQTFVLDIGRPADGR